MRFYKVLGTNYVMFKQTRDDAHRHAKGMTDRLDVEIHEIEVPNDRDTMFLLMVSDPAEMPFNVLRRYELTDRGGLREITNEP